MNKNELSHLKDIIAGLEFKADHQLEILSRMVREQKCCQQNAFCQEWLKDLQEREKKLVHAVQEAIEVLEESKKSFRSRQLERLRKKLISVLVDLGPQGNNCTDKKTKR